MAQLPAGGQPRPTAATLDLRLRPRRGGAPFPPAAASTTLDPGRALAFEDVVGELFGLDQAVGSLEIHLPGGEAPIVATSRAFNAAPDGSYGQGVPAVTEGVGPRAVITHVDGAGLQRTNLGVCEVAGHTARVRAAILDARGRQLGQPLTLEPGPFELVQIDDVFAAAGAPPTANCRIELEQVSGAGEIVAYASVVDGVTGDAIFVPAVTLPE